MKGSDAPLTDGAGCGLLLVAAFIVAAFSFGTGYELGRSNTRDEAIAHHAAEYRCDPETGKTTFVWLTDDTEAEKETP